MKLHEIDEISNKNMFRVFWSFIILVILFMLLNALIGYDIEKNKIGILVLILVIAMPVSIVFCLSFYGLLRIYCYLSEDACSPWCQKCFYRCCINPNFEKPYEIIEL